MKKLEECYPLLRGFEATLDCPTCLQRLTLAITEATTQRKVANFRCPHCSTELAAMVQFGIYKERGVLPG